MRGKEAPTEAAATVDRITPAYAGKRGLSAEIFIGDKDHPRLCGEKLIARSMYSPIMGSPPPMRGKACGVLSKRDMIRDHPRLCGEKQRLAIVTGSRAGSPPPMRGKVFDQIDQKQLSGITPAYAGKSNYSLLRKTAARDHPRLCGEKQPQSLPQAVIRGSPPPMRGKAIRNDFLAVRDGITPAYAGKSFRTGCFFCSVWDHPRLCGEKWDDAGRADWNIGSPPPMRGKEAMRSGKPLRVRITPAYAGKSRFHACDMRITVDHPRLCGEKWNFNHCCRESAGSPPPMRGKARH